MASTAVLVAVLLACVIIIIRFAGKIAKLASYLVVVALASFVILYLTSNYVDYFFEKFPGELDRITEQNQDMNRIVRVFANLWDTVRYYFSF